MMQILKRYEFTKNSNSNNYAHAKKRKVVVMKENVKVENTISNSEENWDNGVLGREEEFVKIAESISVSDMQDMLELQLISIRLQKGMIRDLKSIAKHNNLGGYQPLIRRVLERYIDAEMKMIARDKLSEELKGTSEVEKEVPYQQDLASACG